MPAGLNCKVNIIRLTETTDDEVGGANPTGTVLHQNISARIDEDAVDTAFLQQGLETVKVFSGMLQGYRLTLREQDEVEVVSPPNHKYYGKKFRIVTQTETSNHPAQKRNVNLVKLTISRISHSNVYQ